MVSETPPETKGNPTPHRIKQFLPKYLAADVLLLPEAVGSIVGGAAICTQEPGTVLGSSSHTPRRQAAPSGSAGGSISRKEG